jgi:TetR/AcrR family transcriptional regulator, transcriptional repressor for nem operon
MPRLKTHTPEMLVDRAMLHFWSHGFEATSMDDLVRATGVSRHGLYGDFANKEDLFIACLQAYGDTIVTSAFAQVEHQDADLDAIARYFEQQIARGEAAGLPGPGCLIANTMTEIAPHNGRASAVVEAHNARLRTGFMNALANAAFRTGAQLDTADLDGLSIAMVIFTHGLWSMSRCVQNADTLRQAVKQMLGTIEKRILT